VWFTKPADEEGFCEVMSEGLPSEAAHGRGVGQRRDLSTLAQAVVLLQDAQREVLQQLRLV